MLRRVLIKECHNGTICFINCKFVRKLGFLSTALRAWSAGEGVCIGVPLAWAMYGLKNEFLQALQPASQLTFKVCEEP